MQMWETGNGGMLKGDIYLGMDGQLIADGGWRSLVRASHGLCFLLHIWTRGTRASDLSDLILPFPLRVITDHIKKVPLVRWRTQTLTGYIRYG
jgi:hypothetical protein